MDEIRLFRRWVHLDIHASMTPKDIIRDLVFGPNAAVFPTMTKIAIVYLLLPLGTATVERSFSTLNRIACAERNRLDDAHQCCLLRISAAEGPAAATDLLINKAFQYWLQKP